MRHAASAQAPEHGNNVRRAHLLQIGDWRVDGDLNEIDRAGKVVHLEPKAMAVLLTLAERPGEVVSREELLAAVWPGVIVSDNALTQVVIKLRRALEDSPREPKYLQSIALPAGRQGGSGRRFTHPNRGFGRAPIAPDVLGQDGRYGPGTCRGRVGGGMARPHCPRALGFFGDRRITRCVA